MKLFSRTIGANKIAQLYKSGSIMAERMRNTIGVYSCILEMNVYNYGGRHSQKKIMEETGLSKNTVMRAIKLLIKIGVITKKQNGRFMHEGISKVSPNTYSIEINGELDTVIMETCRLKNKTITNYQSMDEFLVAKGGKGRKKNGRVEYNCPKCGGVHTVTIGKTSNDVAYCHSCKSGFNMGGINFFEFHNEKSATKSSNNEEYFERLIRGIVMRFTIVTW